MRKYTDEIEDKKEPLMSQSIRILRLPDVIDRVGIKQATIYKRISEGSFPKQVDLGGRAVGWFEHEIDAWLGMRVPPR